jgi:hypothetical protein
MFNIKVRPHPAPGSDGGHNAHEDTLRNASKVGRIENKATERGVRRFLNSASSPRQWIGQAVQE